MKKKWSMKAKLSGVMAIASLMAIVQFCTMAFNQMKSIADTKRAQAKTFAEGYMDKIDRNLFERYGDVQAFALSEPARSGSPKRIEAFMNDMMGTYAPIYDVMMVVNLEGKVVAANTVDKNGKPLDTSSLLGKSYANAEWFKAAVSGKIEPATSYVEDLHFDADVAAVLKNDGAVMNFTAPIRDKDSGRILGVWTNRMSWADVVQGITKEELAKVTDLKHQSIFVTLVDANGTYLLHPDPSLILKEKDSGFDTYKDASKKETVFHQEKEEWPTFSGEMIEAIASSKGYSTYPGKGWFATALVPMHDPIETLTWYKIIFGILCQVGCWLLGAWIISSIVRSIEAVMSKLNAESEEVRAAALQITQGSQNLASAATEQASALQETASSVEEMNAMVKKSAENATRSRDVAGQSQSAANKGKDAVDQMNRAINEINSSNDRIMRQVEESNRQITDIVKVITEIGNKTKVINDIVFQTKLLSFNASVEAARAGEHGKGFAVVAEEVGNLAQMSGNAAKEIADMLNGSIQKVEGIVSETKSRVERLIAEGKAKVESGTVVAKQCGEILEDVVKNVGDVNHMIGEISTASNEQSTGINEITKAMNQLDQVTHENATTSQQAASNAQQLMGQADHLMGIIGELRTVVRGGMGSHESPSWSQKPVAHNMKPSEPEEAPAPAPGPDMRWKSFQKEPRHSNPPPVKKVVGGDEVPSEDDPRFKDF